MTRKKIICTDCLNLFEKKKIHLVITKSKVGNIDYMIPICDDCLLLGNYELKTIEEKPKKKTKKNVESN